MTPQRRAGLLITMEGGEGSGKSTQLPRLASYLRKIGYPVLETKEPGGTPSGKSLRRLLLSNSRRTIVPHCELLLYLADRAQHVAEVVIPALSAGTIVLCDRYADATLAYQGYGRGLSRTLVIRLNRFVTNGLTPNLTLLLDLPPEVGLARARNRPSMDRLDREVLSFHRRVRKGYRDMARSEPRRIKVINAGRHPDEVSAEIQKQTKRFLDTQCRSMTS